jgi:endonuclease/exonuclease/phosphatase family metal-dependent hydrolase
MAAGPPGHFLPPGTFSPPGAFKSPESPPKYPDKFFQGVLKSLSGSKYGFIECSELHRIYKRDVFIGAADLPDGAKPKALLRFSLCENTSGQPQAKQVQVVHAAPYLASADDQPPVCREGHTYRGVLKRFSAKGGYGFIVCAELAEVYDNDIYVNASEFTDVRHDAICCGVLLDFHLALSSKGQPQAHAVFLVDTAEVDSKAAHDLLPGLDLDAFETCGNRSSSGIANGRLLSWNILAPAYATCEFFPDAAPESLRWSRRSAQIRAVLAKLAPDVVCLQEVEVDRSLEDLGLDSASFGSCAVQRPGGRTDGCVTLWRKDRLSLVQEYRVSYDQAYSTMAARLPNLTERFLTGHVAVILELRPTQGESVLVVNTHLACGLQAEDVRVWQMSMLFYYIAALHDKISSKCTVLCGDFNSIHGGDVHRYISSNFTSAYGDIEASMATSSNASGEAGGFAETIDYCWLKGVGIQACQRLCLPNKEHLRTLLGGKPHPAPIPTLGADGSWPSDHLPIVVDFEFTDGCVPVQAADYQDGYSATLDEDIFVQVSKKLSWILRHGARQAGVWMDNKGWVKVRDIAFCTFLKDLVHGEAELLKVIHQSNQEKQRRREEILIVSVNPGLLCMHQGHIGGLPSCNLMPCCIHIRPRNSPSGDT